MGRVDPVGAGLQQPGGFRQTGHLGARRPWLSGSPPALPRAPRERLPRRLDRVPRDAQSGHQCLLPDPAHRGRTYSPRIVVSTDRAAGAPTERRLIDSFTGDNLTSGRDDPSHISRSGRRHAGGARSSGANASSASSFCTKASGRSACGADSRNGCMTRQAPGRSRFRVSGTGAPRRRHVPNDRVHARRSTHGGSRLLTALDIDRPMLVGQRRRVDRLDLRRRPRRGRRRRDRAARVCRGCVP